MHFKDRISDFPNRKRLKVEEIVMINDQIDEIIADVFREDGNVEEQGTQLNAQNLNNVVEGIYNSLRYLFKDYHFIEDDMQNIYWWYTSGTYRNKKTFNISGPFYVILIITHPYLKETVTYDIDGISIKIEETDELHNTPGAFTWDLEFKVEIYFDQDYSNILTTYEGLIKYTNNSTNPLD